MSEVKTWHDFFEEFVASIEEYVALELPADASPAERKLQKDLHAHLINYKQARLLEEEIKRDRDS